MDEVKSDTLEEVLGVDSFVFLASVESEVVLVAWVFTTPGELEGRVIPGTAEDVKGINNAEVPLFLSVSGLVVEGESIFSMIEAETPVEKEILVLSLNSDLVEEVTDGSLTLNRTVEIELEVAVGEDTIVIVKLEAVVLDACIESAGIAEGEPELELISSGDLALLLGQGFLEGDAGGGRLAGGLEGEKLVMNEVVLENGPLALLEGSPGFSLE